MSETADWGPARWVPRGVTCDFCWQKIPASKPGTTTGTRGTKAWFNRRLNVWECIPCRCESTRAELAKEAGSTSPLPASAPLRDQARAARPAS